MTLRLDGNESIHVENKWVRVLSEQSSFVLLREVGRMHRGTQMIFFFNTLGDDDALREVADAIEQPLHDVKEVRLGIQYVRCNSSGEKGWIKYEPAFDTAS